MNLPGPVHATLPICNGICFDEVSDLGVDDINRAAGTGGVFVTKFRALGADGAEGWYGGLLIASDWDHAQQRADERGLGEVIEGALHSVVPAEEGDEPPQLPGNQ